MAGWLFFKHETAFGCGNNVSFLALSVNFLQLISGWTGKARDAVGW